MKLLRNFVILAILFTATQSVLAESTGDRLIPQPPVSDVFEEIKDELGFVPGFFYKIPERTLRDQWNLFRDMFLRTEGPLSSKQKELIGLAVAGMKMCDYCIPMHHALARYHGATEEEVNEVAQVARSVGQWSTFFYSINYPFKQFEQDLEKILKNLP